jgi:hypothetical protein
MHVQLFGFALKKGGGGVTVTRKYIRREEGYLKTFLQHYERPLLMDRFSRFVMALHGYIFSFLLF